MKVSLLAVLFLSCVAVAAFGEDKNGLRLLVTKKTLNRADGAGGSYTREVNRSMALKAFFKNISNKDLSGAKVECAILIRRWGLSETGAVQRYAKAIELVPLKTAQESEMLVGEYQIGGHMHGSSDMHVDQVVAWKVTVDHDGKKTEYLSGSNFEALNKHATAPSN